MDSISICKTHLELLKGILVSSIEEYPGFLVVKSYLNDNWYDSITITNPKLLDWDFLMTVANNLKETGIDYALYFPIEFLPVLIPLLDSTFKRVGGDSYMVITKIPGTFTSISKEIQIELVTKENFNDYKALINEIHGNEMGWPATKRFSDRMFKVQEANSSNEKQVELFLAYYHDKPVGYSSSITSKELSTTYLTASGVLSEYRGKGIYSSMISSRLNKAIELGLQTAYVITGQEGSSWNVAKKFGYEEVGKFEYYLRNSS